ncbi:MAG: hypothetical protein ABIB71_07790 [Candidatus Woesearchaeota archaeon]
MAEKDVVVTFETLFELLRMEKFRTELQKLDADFFSSVIEYLKAKEAIVKSQENKKSIFSSESEKTRNQLKNSRKMIKDIYERRETKILQNALLFVRIGDSGLKFSSMLTEEEALFTEVADVIRKHRCDTLEKVLDMQSPKKPKALKGGSSCKKPNMVRLVEDVPAFVGKDLNTYGPFSKGEKPELPAEVVEMLVEMNKAEKV